MWNLKSYSAVCRSGFAANSLVVLSAHPVKGSRKRYEEEFGHHLICADYTGRIERWNCSVGESISV